MGEDSSSDEKDVERPLVAKSAVDLQRLKLQKLMKNPDKPIIIPDRPKIKGTPSVPEFVRNVMGSSAGAGSGEFHVYRHLRRKEYSRQKYIQEKGQKELLDEEYHRKLEENKKLADEVTAKKRAKRLKKKQKLKQKKFKPSDKNKNKNNQKTDSDKSDSDNESSDEENSHTTVKTDDTQNKAVPDLIQENSKTVKDDDITTAETEKNIKMETDNGSVETEKDDIHVESKKNDKNLETEKHDENVETENNDKNAKTEKDDENVKTETDDENVKTENSNKTMQLKDNASDNKNDELKSETIRAVKNEGENCR